MNEATIKDTEHGKVMASDGWFILNLREVAWQRSPHNGTWSAFDPDGVSFAQFGIGVHVLRPGEAPGYYHAESDQEGFLVLEGECIAVVEGEERRMRQWDFFHCPAGTNHITVGAGDGPCAILMVGARTPGKSIHYPVNETAAKHGASVRVAADNPRDAYAQATDHRWWPDRSAWPSSP